jgi:hypothetical protein
MATNKVTVDNLTTKSKYSFTVTNMPASFLELAIGYVAGAGGNDVKGIQGGMYCIPQLLTNAELAAHYQNPEQTISVSNGTLKSAFLPQATLDAMAGGNGYCYLLNENNKMGAVVRNLCKVPVVLNSNSDFADATGVLADSLWAHTSGQWTLFPATTAWQGLRLQELLSAGKTFAIDYDVTDISGVAKAFITGNASVGGKEISTVGVHRFIITITADGNAFLARKEGALSITVASCKIYEVGADGSLALVANYGNSAMRDNADRLSVGYQNAVVEKNAFGVPTGLTKDGEFEFDGKSYVDLLNKEVTGDWYLDVFMDAQRASNGRFMYCEILNGVGSVRSSFFLFNEGTQQQIRLFTDTTIGNAGKGNTGFGRGIVTIERVGGDVLLYANGVLKNTIPTVFATIRFRFVSKTGGTTYSDFDSGSLSIETGTRTDAQRATTVPKLMLKHGVT